MIYDSGQGTFIIIEKIRMQIMLPLLFRRMDLSAESFEKSCTQSNFNGLNAFGTMKNMFETGEV